MGLFRKLGRIPEEGPSFRVETSCSIKRLLEDEELCCCFVLGDKGQSKCEVFLLDKSEATIAMNRTSYWLALRPLFFIFLFLVTSARSFRLELKKKKKKKSTTGVEQRSSI